MFINQLRMTTFRNFPELQISPSPSFNIIYGVNGAGKSSILEAIHVLGFGRSFRTNKADNLINTNDASQATVFCSYKDVDSSQVLGFSRTKGEGFTFNINGNKSGRIGDVVRIMPVQIFTPQSTELITGSPSLRRRYLDWLLFHVEHEFLGLSQAYNKVLKQRNAFLKSCHLQTSQYSKFDEVWANQVADYGEKIDKLRKQYVNDLNDELIGLYKEFKPEINVEIRYNQGWEREKDLASALSYKTERDIFRGFTSVGTHKSDLRFYVEGKEVSEFLSRGQLRVLVSLLLIAEVKVLRKKTNKNTIFLVDDISAELDETTREFFLDKAVEDSSQLFVTAIEKQQLTFADKYKNKKVFHVKHNSVFEE
ncbi:DNA replication/repair protein RecF [Agaribacter flavus]|uniref:DNA replication and repair protein RecF n=1 Tax=Agaribacter flavus TaxID=1902781 RepID=A0ABV7FNY7_9ALTE